VQRDIEKSRGHETNKQNKATSKEPFKALREERGGHRGVESTPAKEQPHARMRDGPVEGLLLEFHYRKAPQA